MGHSVGNFRHIEPRFGHKIWNVHQRIIENAPTTNNHLERFNRELNKEISAMLQHGGKKITFYRALRVYKQMMVNGYKRFMERQIRQRPANYGARKELRSRRNEDFVSLLEGYGNGSWIEFVSSIQSRFQFSDM